MRKLCIWIGRMSIDLQSGRASSQYMLSTVSSHDQNGEFWDGQREVSD